MGTTHLKYYFTSQLLFFFLTTPNYLHVASGPFFWFPSLLNKTGQAEEVPPTALFKDKNSLCSLLVLPTVPGGRNAALTLCLRRELRHRGRTTPHPGFEGTTTKTPARGLVWDPPGHTARTPIFPEAREDKGQPRRWTHRPSPKIPMQIAFCMQTPGGLRPP